MLKRLFISGVYDLWADIRFAWLAMDYFDHSGLDSMKQALMDWPEPEGEPKIKIKLYRYGSI